MRRMYSENQLVNVLEDKDIVAKTIKQKEPNWKVDSSVFDTVGSTLPEGVSYEKVYATFEEINGVAYFVWNFKIKNETETSYNFSLSKNIDLPEEIADKIYDFDGKKVSESNSSNICTANTFYGFATELYNTKQTTIRNSLTENRIQIIFVSAVVVNANSTCNLSFRIFLTLI